jgi:coenzyme F420-dependent glucose-6-phosphate dehydrogenase
MGFMSWNSQNPSNGIPELSLIHTSLGSSVENSWRKVMTFGFHASHEQFTPSTLLKLAQAAEKAGFEAGLCSDHFYPWSKLQGQSGFAWSWLGAALQATNLPFGVVCAPGQRYHPAIIAQAAATLAEMFPGRFWIAVGSGQLLNEGITGEGWPPKALRNERLLEAVEIMRALWAGERVTHHGHVWVEEAELYTLPSQPPLLIGAAVTAETAEWVGEWADGLITISRPKEQLQKVVDAFRRGGGEGKPMYLKTQISYGRTDEEALQGAWEQWRTNVFDSPVLSQLRLPEQFEAAAELVTPESMRGHVRISHDTEKHIEWLQWDVQLGFEHIYIHNVNREQERFINDFGERVLPSLKS